MVDFVEELKKNKIEKSEIINTYLENDNKDTYTYIVKKFKELHTIKKVLYDVLNK